jgi:hypothetical protein
VTGREPTPDVLPEEVSAMTQIRSRLGSWASLITKDGDDRAFSACMSVRGYTVR